MYHNFLTHSSLNGHLGYFHVLAIVDSAALNIEVDESFSIMVSSGYIPSRTIQFDFNIPAHSSICFCLQLLLGEVFLKAEGAVLL